MISWRGMICPLVLLALLAGCQSQIAIIPSATLQPARSPAASPMPLLTPSSTSLIPSTARPPVTPPTATPDTFAPDWVWLARDTTLIYTHRNALCIRRGESPPTYLLEADRLIGVALSDDDEWIALRRAPGGTLLETVSRDGSQPQITLNINQLGGLPPDDLIIRHMAFIPGTHRLAFTTAYYAPGLPPNNDLWVIDAESGALSSALEPGLGGDLFVLAPDGQQVAIVTPRVIYGARLDGSAYLPDLFSYDMVMTASEYFIYALPVWMPDSRGFWLAVPPAVLLEESEISVWQVAADGSGRNLLQTIAPVTMEAGPFSGPVISPEGHYLAYIGADGVETHLHLIDLRTGGDSIYLTAGRLRVGFLEWLDDTHFLFFAEANSNILRGEIGGGYEPVARGELPGCAPVQ